MYTLINFHKGWEKNLKRIKRRIYAKFDLNAAHGHRIDRLVANRSNDNILMYQIT